jgi:uncharacterized membrane protein YhaH (DUF805 family)
VTPGQLLFSFDGRIGRSDFWLAWLPVAAAINSIMFRIGYLLNSQIQSHHSLEITLLAAGLFFLSWMAYAIQAKRYHDRGKSGWWSLVATLPILGAIVLIAELGFFPGDRGSNSFGPAPGSYPKPNQNLVSDQIAAPPSLRVPIGADGGSFLHPRHVASPSTPLDLEPDPTGFRHSSHQVAKSPTHIIDTKPAIKEQAEADRILGEAGDAERIRLQLAYGKKSHLLSVEVAHFGTKASASYENAVRAGRTPEAARDYVLAQIRQALSFLDNVEFDAANRIAKALYAVSPLAAGEFLSALEILQSDFDPDAAIRQLQTTHGVELSDEYNKDWQRLMRSPVPHDAAMKLADPVPAVIANRFAFLMERFQANGDYNLMTLRSPDSSGSLHVIGEAKNGSGGFRALTMDELERAFRDNT